ncbi:MULTISPECIES: phosphopyruvate hydratase [unclassified Roseburia]|jgi:enolase|uniref:phosphopyruvate hydratase n=1 Tax=unclassified Roseburia TaxID=2637578 RepID=UPI000E42D24E|nr:MULTISPECIES: phosphopyruvate hydratase [unclassified Roseburia]RGF46887.1 phosphopyruvate hydratase [Roseburia sp. AF42-8]RHQ41966.1 phosphopyruvate hydratase [Roseburia sp. AF25-18LB]RHQ42080.1 phosphopyruvate hydratase [Roseburia sp. AF25-25LB]RHQ48429.1 phosphopyruvate hydratase [Roseburia sp. AF25-15LB]RHQ48614.1 phosphopyruvate hydratase [Roseburia sp. AF25-13LB]
MAVKMTITRIHAREILDSRGNPTIETEVTVETETTGKKSTARAAAPSGASTGEFEAIELRDGGERYGGNGVQQAVENVNTRIAKALIGRNVLRQENLDALMLELDGTENKGKLGANAILSVSLACAKAAAKALQMPLYRYVGGVNAVTIPVPMMNILNGGAHSDNNLDVQEFMILPIGADSITEGIRWCAEVYHHLKKILKNRGLSVAVGDEGGFAPDITNEEEAIQLIMEAITKAGYSCGRGKQFMISLDAAASEWKGNAPGEYYLPKSGKRYTTDELIVHWEKMIRRFPIYSIEDPLDEEDWDGWKRLTEKVGDKVILVGDDLFVTNPVRLNKGISMGCGNAILIKPNQIGTLSETMEAIRMAKEHGYETIMSHRSGETEDTTIADLSVGLGSDLIKTGAPCRGERTAKYNRLIRIEES